jgi:hypothetical protein
MKAQLLLNEPEPEPFADLTAFIPSEPAKALQNGGPPTKRYNAFGILEDIPPEELVPKAAEEPKPRDRKDRKKKSR